LYKAKVLIISNRKELSIKYKKLIDNLKHDAIFTNDLSYALSVIQKEEIEFIIISDTIKEKLSEFIRKIRILTYNSRPVIIAVSKSGDLEDKLEALEYGADDFLGEEISKIEFQTRFKAHLRRYIESSLNPITRLLDKKLTIKEIKKNIFEKKTNAYLLIKINGIELYRKIYGEIAYEKVLQTLSAIINSTLASDDCAGHIQESEFILITNSMQAEKIASFLTFAFDNILDKFYSNDEFENNLIIQSSDNVKEENLGLIRLNIAVCENSEKNDFRDVINNLYELMQLIEKQEKKNSSTYVVERIKLRGETIKKQIKNKVLILEPDCALSCLLKNICELNNFEAVVSNNPNEFSKIYKDFCPDLILLDWEYKKEEDNLNLAEKIVKDDVKLIFSSSFLNKKEILKTGANLYLPKPYEIDDVVFWFKKFLN